MTIDLEAAIKEATQTQECATNITQAPNNDQQYTAQQYIESPQEDVMMETEIISTDQTQGSEKAGKEKVMFLVKPSNGVEYKLGAKALTGEGSEHNQNR